MKTMINKPKINCLLTKSSITHH